MLIKSLVIQFDITGILLFFCLCWPIYTVRMETSHSTSKAGISSQKLGEKKVRIGGRCKTGQRRQACLCQEKPRESFSGVVWENFMEDVGSKGRWNWPGQKGEGAGTEGALSKEARRVLV